MLSIQEVGLQIFGDSPGTFYVFGGSEYGIKEKYIEVLKNKYGSQIESNSVKSLIEMLSKKHIIPLEPAVYVVRYDESFVSEISEPLASKIQKLTFNGTIVCLYESSKHIKKIDKFLPNCTVAIDQVSPQFVAKYLRSDFPELSDRLIGISVHHGDNYNQCKNMCRSMSLVPESEFSTLSDSQIAAMFGCSDASTESQVRQGVAARQFNQLVSLIEMYEEDTDRILYAILQTMIELDKVLDNSRVQSDIRAYAKYWTREDVYYMFMHTYQELKRSRSISSYDIKMSLIYLFGLLKFQRIPSLEVMNS